MLRNLATAFRSLPRGLVTCREYTTIQQLAVKAVIGDDPDLPKIRDMRQGQKVSPVFSGAEFEARLRTLRARMAERQIGGVVLTSLHNINYFSGFLYCAFGRNYALVVTPEDCTTVSSSIDGGQPWRVSHADNIAYTDHQRDNFFHAVRTLLPHVRGHLGLEMDHVTVDNKASFQAAFPTSQLVDIGYDTMRMRMKKSPEEIALIRQGARIADLGGAALVDALHEGVPEYEVALASTAAMVREIAKTYPDAELLDTWSWFQSGINTDGAHNPVTTRQVLRGDILSLNCFPMIAGYHASLERTLFFESASDRHLQLWEINCEVHRRGLQLIRPGIKCSEIAAELNEIYRSHGLLRYRSFGFGYSFGCLCHYYGRERELEFREDIDTVLEPGMVVSMVPMINIPQGQPGAGGYREHNILVVTDDGAENITEFPYGPEHNIIKK